MATATHVRLNNSWLAASEKRLLIRMAERLPRWVHSDHLSALGLAAMAGAKCPECGAYATIRKDGCDYCTHCGHIGACG